MQIFSNPVANNYKSHVDVNGVVTFWLISTSGSAIDSSIGGGRKPTYALSFYYMNISNCVRSILIYLIIYLPQNSLHKTTFHLLSFRSLTKNT